MTKPRIPADQQMIRFNLYIHPTLMAKTNAAAKRRGVSVSRYIRELLMVSLDESIPISSAGTADGRSTYGSRSQ